MRINSLDGMPDACKSVKGALQTIGISKTFHKTLEIVPGNLRQRMRQLPRHLRLPMRAIKMRNPQLPVDASLPAVTQILPSFRREFTRSVLTFPLLRGMTRAWSSTVGIGPTVVRPRQDQTHDDTPNNRRP